MADDPLTEIGDAFWTMLEAYAAFDSLVPSGNRLKYSSGDYDPSEHSTGIADFPRVAVMYWGLTHHMGETVPILQNTSSSNLMMTLWSIETQTRPKRINEKGNLDIIILRACMNWPTYFANLTWEGYTFVPCLRVMGTQSKIQEMKLAQNLCHWHTSISIHVPTAIGRTLFTP